MERANVVSIFQTINQRAEAIKADRWAHYIPLTPFQLTDYDAAADDEECITVLAMSVDPSRSARSTQRSPRAYKHFKILKRPTEVRAIKHANGALDGNEDFRVDRIEIAEPLRWCILCKCRHPVETFIFHKRYLHGVSYACRDKLLAGFHGRRWRIAC